MTWRSSAQAAGVLTPVAGQRSQLQLVNGKLGKFITFRIDADVAISGAAATSIANRGLASALVDEILLVENGENRHEITGKAMAMMTQAMAPSAPGPVSRAPLSAVAIGNYHISETVRMFFRTPLQARPDETAFIERDQRQGLFASVRLAADPVAALLVKGAATVAVTNVTVRVTQEWHQPDASTVAPYFIPTCRQSTLQVTGAGAQQQLFLRAQNNVRAIVISQEAAGLEVSDIINSLTLRGDSRFVIGPNPLAWADLLAQSELSYGGVVRPSNDSHLFLGFMEDGLLSNTLNPTQDTNLRLEFNAQPSASAGTSQIRATFFELEHTPGITSPVPFPY